MPDWNNENSSLKKNAYLHIPKAASTTVGLYMKKYSHGVSNDMALNGDVKNMSEFRDYFIYTFCRNPYKKIISCYEYLLTHKEIPEWNKENMNREYFTFDRFVSIITQEINPIYQRKPCWNVYWEPQTSFIFNNAGKLHVDYIGRVENLVEDINYICNEIGLNLTSTGPCCHKLQSDGHRPKWKIKSIGAAEGSQSTWLHSDYKSYYTDDIKKKIDKYYEKDIDFFKTTF